jgi:hypothetical protein
VPAAAIAAVLGLAACGGGSTASTARTATGGEATATTASPAAKNGSPPGRAGHDKASSGGSAPSGASGGSSASGGAAAFETKGGDNSIQRSGSAASSTELGQAAAVLHGYLDARAAGAWGRACSYLAAGVASQLSQLAAGAKGKAAPSCSKLLATLSAGVPPAALREAAIARPGALRVRGSGAFLLYHGARGTDYFMPMAREGGRWKVAALAASALS